MVRQKELRAALQVMREGILMIDAQSRIVFANHSYLEFLNESEEELLGRPPAGGAPRSSAARGVGQRSPHPSRPSHGEK